MKLNIPKKQTGHLMTDLGIDSNRCVELCNRIHEVIQRQQQRQEGTTKAQIVQEALEESRNDAETVFISITAGEFFAEYENGRESSGMGVEQLMALLTGRASVFSQS